VGDEVLHNGPTFSAIVTQNRVSGTPMQIFHGCEPQEADRLANTDGEQRDRSYDRERKTDPAEPAVSQEKVFDQISYREAEGNQNQTTRGAPKQRPPTEATSRQLDWTID